MSLARFWSSLKLLHFSKPAGDRPLYQAVRRRAIRSVLEVRVGDASRSQRLVEWLAQQSVAGTETAGEPIRYAAVDPFEAGGEGHLGLKEFHARLGRLGTRPLPVPLVGSLATSLKRVAHTIGAVDLLILDCPADELQDPAVEAILPRLVHSDSIVLIADAATGTLQLHPADRYADPTDRRAAA